MSTKLAVTTMPNKGVVQVLWENLTQTGSDVGNGQDISRWGDKTVQAVGTFGASGAVTIEGSEDGSTWGALTDEQGTALAIGDSLPVLIAQNPKFIRPHVTAGDGTTDLDVYLTGRRDYG